jgi:hypothetical protein
MEKEIERRKQKIGRLCAKGSSLKGWYLKGWYLQRLERKGITHEFDSLLPCLNKKELLKISSSKSRDLKFNHKV